jgi:hypothetical protein
MAIHVTPTPTVWLIAAFAFGIVGAAPAQWAIQNSNTTADLRGIDNVGGGVAWASGTNGTVLRTEDGGYVWQSCAKPPGAEKLDFRGIQAFDANTAIVMSSGKGDLSRLYKTTDGCQSWKLVFTNPDKDGFWDAVSFGASRAEGVLLGDPVKGRFVLFASGDGGKSWVRQVNRGLTADAKTQGAFAASNSSLAAFPGFIRFASGGAEGAFVYRMVRMQICLDDCPQAELNHDGIKNTWERTIIPVGSHTDFSGVFSIATDPTTSASSIEIVAVGGDYKKPDESSDTAAYTTDAGDHWEPAKTPPHGYRSAVAYDAASKTWITVGPNGTDISIDDGKNWRALKPDPARHEAPDADRNWNALSLPFVVGPKGRIGKLNPAALK